MGQHSRNDNQQAREIIRGKNKINGPRKPKERGNKLYYYIKWDFSIKIK